MASPLGAQGLSYADDFESYGTPADPPGWFDSAPGNPTQEAPGLYKTATDPADAGNVVFAKQSASDSFTHLRTHAFSSAAELELSGRFRRSKDSARFGVTFFSSFPTPATYLRLGQSASGCGVRLESVGLGALAGDFDSGLSVERNRWYRFRVLAEPAGAGLRIRARVWAADGAEPAYWQIDAGLATRPAGSWIGLWGAGAGEKLWDDLEALSEVQLPPTLRWLEEGVELQDGAQLARSIAPTVEATGTPPLDVETRLDGEPWNPGDEIATSGAHLLEATVVDALGATASRSVTVTLAIPDCTLLATRYPEDGELAALLAARGGAFRAAAEARVGGAGDWELALRPDLSESGASWVTAHFDPWPNDTAVDFRMVADGSNMLRVALGRDDLTAAVANPEGNDLVGDADDLVLRARARGSSGAIHFEELRLNGRPIGEMLAANGASGADLDLLRLEGCELGGGYRLTGRIRMAWTGSPVPAGDDLVVQAALLHLPDPVAPLELAVLESGAPLAEGAVFRRPVTPVLQVTGTEPVAVEATLDGAPFIPGTSIADEGGHLLAVHAADAAGQSADLARTFTIDRTPPELTALQPAEGAVVADAEITLSGRAVGASTLTIDGAPVALAGDAFVAGPLALGDSGRTFHLIATDLAGNVQEQSHSVLRDTVAPALAIAQPAEGALVGAATARVSGSASDAHLAGVTVNGVEASFSGTSFVALQVPIVEGENLVVARAVDRAGNAAEATRALVRDSEAPLVEITDPAAGTVVPDATLTLRGTVADPHLDRVEVGGRRATVAGGAWSVSVPLVEGENTLVARAVDRLGHTSEASRVVRRDSEAPALEILSPADGARTREATVAVTGSIEEADGITLTVNGQPATIAGLEFAVQAVPLVEGENRLIARLTDALGNQGVRTRKVYRDSEAPRWLGSDPSSGASALPATARFRLTFSEPIDPASLEGVALSGPAGPLGAEISSVASEVVVVPTASLPEEVDLALAIGTVTDLAGNPLANPTILIFRTADAQGPAAPALAAAPPAFLCATSVDLAGSTEPLARIEATGGAATATTRADGAGTFALGVELVPESYQRIELVAIDGAGNRSPATAVDVTADCVGPAVLGAVRAADSFSVRLSEPVAPSTVAGAVEVAAAAGPLAGEVVLASDSRQIVWTSAVPLPAEPLRLAVGEPLADRAGNPLQYPFAESFGEGGGASFLAATALDAATGRPLGGVRAVVVTTGGVARPLPLPEATSGVDGRIRLPIEPGTHGVVVSRAGWTPAFRLAEAVAERGTDLLDPRLTPTGGWVAPAGGVVEGTGETLAAGATPRLSGIAGVEAVSLTALSEQALPALLPYGWSPRGAVWLDLDGQALAGPATLELPVEAAPGRTLALARLELSTLTWRVLDVVVASGGTVTLEVDREGAYVAAEADPPPFAVPAAVVGEILGSLPAPDGETPTTAALDFDPQVVLPAQRSLATATYGAGEPLVSGAALTLRVAEELALLDGTLRREAPFEADLVAYRAPDGAYRSRFWLQPSTAATLLPIEAGAEDVLVRRYGGEAVRGNVLGPAGGTVVDEQGHRIEIPAGALPAPTPIAVEAVAILPLAVPDRLEAVGLLAFDFAGRTLARPATALFATAGAPAGERGLLLALTESSQGAFWRPVAEIVAGSEGWTSLAADDADLPWPGLVESGTYLFARRLEPLGFLRGSVRDVGGELLAGARVEGAGLGWAQLSRDDGRYALPAPLGERVIRAADPASDNSVTRAALVAAAEERVDLDLQIEVVAPVLLEASPADGASGVSVDVEPQLRFSEPIAAASLSAGLRLLRGGEPVVVDFIAQGALVTVVPGQSLEPETEYELVVGVELRDLQGNPLAGATTVRFVTAAADLPGGIDLTRIVLIEPDAAGLARVEGAPGAVPAGALVAVDNETGAASTVSMEALADGSFVLEIGAALADRLILHVIVPGQNEVVAPLGPFLTTDRRGAWIGASGGGFTTRDGFGVRVPEGAFAATTRLRVEVEPAAPAANPLPEGFLWLAGFRLDFGGAVAARGLELTLPAPAATPTDVDLLVSRDVTALGRRGWMLMQLATRAGGRLEVAEGSSAEAAAVAPVAAAEGVRVVAAGAAEGAEHAAAGIPAPAASSALVTRPYLPGLVYAGSYSVSAAQQPVGYVAAPLVFAYDVVYEASSTGYLAAVDAALARLLGGRAVLLPIWLDRTTTLRVSDLATGLVLAEVAVDPPAPEELVVALPPDAFGDFDPPFPTGGSPIRFFAFVPTAAGAGDLDAGVRWSTTGEGVRVVGSPGAVAFGAQVKLYDLTAETEDVGRGGPEGEFDLSLEASEAGHRFLLVLSGQVLASAPLELEFSEALAADAAGFEVRSGGGTLAVTPRPSGDASRWILRPEGGWPATQPLSLHLGRELADAAGNRWEREVEIELGVRTSDLLGAYPLAQARDVERMGALLFVAADRQGLAVVDASNPRDLRSYLDGGLTFPLALNDPVRGLAQDAHGRLIVVGGGAAGYGVLQIFDPLRLPQVREADDPAAARALAWRGAMVISDALGGSAEGLPEGTPRDLVIVSTDTRDEWRVGSAVPAGITADFTPDSSDPGAPGTLVVSGTDGTAGAPVTLRRRDAGIFERTDAASDGGYTVALRVAPGDWVELARNQATLAYVATLGVGIEVVDVNAAYDRSEASLPSPENLLGLYTGYQDPALRLCGQPVVDVSTATIDVAGLFESTAAFPLVPVGLAAFEGFFALSSPAEDAGALGFLSEQCADFEGERTPWGLAAAQDLPWDRDGSGTVDAQEAERDYLFVAHGEGALLAYDLTDRARPVRVAEIPLPISALDVEIDRRAMRAYVVGGAGGLAVVDLVRRPQLGRLDEDGDGLDDRLLELVATGEIAPDAAPVPLPELGLVLVAGEGGVAAVAVGGPRLEALASTPAGGRFVVPRLAPLGVPTATVSMLGGQVELPAEFRVRAYLPAIAGAQIELDLVATGAAGAPLADLGEVAELPGTRLAGDDALALQRLSDRPWEAGYQIYESGPVVAVADPRAVAAYERTAREDETCVRCDRQALAVDPQAAEILSGDELRIELPAGSELELVYGADRLDALAQGIASTRWEPAPAPRQEPALSPSLGRGEVVPGTLLHSGEFVRSATDLALRGRGLDVAFTRTYRSQTVGSGPLGPGWDFGYRMRLRELPNGDVDLFDGRGRRETFVRGAGGDYRAPAGWFVELTRTASGWTLVDAQHGITRFDRWGRLLSIADALRTAEDKGNQIRFEYDAASRLSRVVDTLDREVVLAYDEAGRLASLRDFDAREVRYEYDSEGRLERVTSPAVTVGESLFPDGLTTVYEYEEPAGTLAELLNHRDNLIEEQLPRGDRPFTLTYEDADGDQRAEEITEERWGEATLRIAYDFGQRTTTVTDRRGADWVTRHDVAGHGVSLQAPGGGAVTREFDGEGLLTSQTLPLGTVTELVYDVDGPRRSRGNLLRRTDRPGAGGGNGSAGELVTTWTRERYANRPTRIVDARGVVTRIERDEHGLATAVHEGDGSPTRGTTLYDYDDRGRVTRITNPNQHVTELAYFESGDSAGYLESVRVDTGDLGLDLTTRFETDRRGNVTRVYDPRGATHESEYNELDWLVEAVQAATPAADGGAAVGLLTLRRYDANGNVTFELAGGAVTEREVGALGQVLSETRPVSGGASETFTYEYDENLNVSAVTRPGGDVTRFAYDARNALTEVRRGFGTAEETPTTFVNDLEGRPTREVDALGHARETVYDGYGRVARQVDANGNAATREYDDRGDPTALRAYGVGDELLAETRWTFDERGRRTKETRRLWAEGVAAEELETRTEYDPAGNVTATVDEREKRTTLEYDGAERLIRRTDAAGNGVAWTLDAGGNATLAESNERTPAGGTTLTTQAWSYDALGRPVESEDGLANRRTMRWDARGNLEEAIDEEGHATFAAYDELDRVKKLTRPEGIEESFEYDGNSNLRAYRDALGQQTDYAVDALDRPRRETYPDTTKREVVYDAAGRPVSISDAMGTVVTQEFDAGGRLVRRTVARGGEVVGPAVEEYVYDGLDRLVLARSGAAGSPEAVTVERSYDSLSRLVSETTNGRTVSYQYDAAGNETSLVYPSGVAVTREFDALSRPELVRSGGNPAAAYGYRGPDLVAQKELGNGLSGRMSYDAARRRVETSYQRTGAATPVVGESVSRTPRGQIASVARSDEGGGGFVARYDGAGRLKELGRDPGSFPGNNTLPDPLALAGLPDSSAFTFDVADNLLSKSEETSRVVEGVSLPLDGSRRNRPGSVGGAEPLAWNANGNLTRKGDLTFRYDFRNRLTEVATAAGPIASYRYDAFNRRVEKRVGETREETVWSGWQSLETYRDGALASRRTYGLGLDEVVKLEQDRDGDGALDEAQVPLYDTRGNLVALTRGTDGMPVEKYAYSPFGEQRIFVDLTKPRIEQLRREGDRLLLEVSERIQLVALLAAQASGDLTFTHTGTGQSIEVEVTLPVLAGRTGAKRIAIRPTAAVEEGAPLRLHLAPGAILDRFQNPLAGAYDRDLTWSALGAEVIEDTAPPQLDLVVVHEHVLTVGFTEAIAAAQAETAITVDGNPVTWTGDESGYTLHTEPLASGVHRIEIEATLADLAGTPLGESFTRTVEITPTGALLYAKPDPREVSSSAASNPYGFQGLPKDRETGFVYARNRYYDPEMGRFVSADPLGYVDGGNLYQYGLNDPVNNADPLGLDTYSALEGYFHGALEAVDFTGLVPSVDAETAGYGAGTRDAEDFAIAKRAGYAVATIATALKAGVQKAGQWGWKALRTTLAGEVRDQAVAHIAQEAGAAVAEHGQEVGLSAESARRLSIAVERGTQLGIASGLSRKRGSNHPTTRSRAETGQEAHRQLQADLRRRGYRTEVPIELESGRSVRKDAMKGNEVVVIKPDTDSGRKSAEVRKNLMEADRFEVTVVLYDPHDPRYQPGSPTYMGAKRRQR